MKFEKGDIVTIGKSKYTVESTIGLGGWTQYTLKCHASGKYIFFGNDFVQAHAKLVKPSLIIMDDLKEQHPMTKKQKRNLREWYNKCIKKEK